MIYEVYFTTNDSKQQKKMKGLSESLKLSSFVRWCYNLHFNKELSQCHQYSNIINTSLQSSVITQASYAFFNIKSRSHYTHIAKGLITIKSNPGSTYDKGPYKYKYTRYLTSLYNVDCRAESNTKTN